MPVTATSWKKGQSGNPNGRPKSTEIAERRERIAGLVDGTLSAAADLLELLEPKERFEIVLRLLPYVQSKEPERINLDHTTGGQPMLPQVVYIVNPDGSYVDRYGVDRNVRDNPILPEAPLE